MCREIIPWESIIGMKCLLEKVNSTSVWNASPETFWLTMFAWKILFQDVHHPRNIDFRHKAKENIPLWYIKGWNMAWKSLKASYPSIPSGIWWLFRIISHKAVRALVKMVSKVPRGGWWNKRIILLGTGFFPATFSPFYILFFHSFHPYEFFLSNLIHKKIVHSSLIRLLPILCRNLIFLSRFPRNYQGLMVFFAIEVL